MAKKNVVSKNTEGVVSVVKMPIKDEFKGLVIGGTFGGVFVSGKLEDLSGEDMDIILSDNGGKVLLEGVFVEYEAVVNDNLNFGENENE